MLIMCVGLSRSGSTLQYNVARDIVGNTLGGTDVGYSNNEAEIRAAMETNVEDRLAIVASEDLAGARELDVVADVPRAMAAASERLAETPGEVTGTCPEPSPDRVTALGASAHVVGHRLQP